MKLGPKINFKSIYVHLPQGIKLVSLNSQEKQWLFHQIDIIFGIKIQKTRLETYQQHIVKELRNAWEFG